MFVCGIPMLYMELAVGQFTGRGPIGALAQICPLFKGNNYTQKKIIAEETSNANTEYADSTKSND